MNALCETKDPRIRDLNDKARRTFIGCVVVTTHGVDILPLATKLEVMRQVRAFETFSSDNDPHGEHDFGTISVNGTRFFWKFDYYDRDMEEGSEDPADPEKTTRALTIGTMEEF